LGTSSLHPGGKLRDEGPAALTQAELLAILISSGVKGKTALQIAEEVIARFGSIMGLSNQPLERLLGIKGLSDVKIIRLAAALEIARRIRNEQNPGNNRR
jgi:DNA repair protein RadC